MRVTVWQIHKDWEPLSYAIQIKNKLPTQYNSTEKLKIYDVVEILMVERHSKQVGRCLLKYIALKKSYYWSIDLLSRYMMYVASYVYQYMIWLK